MRLFFALAPDAPSLAGLLRIQQRIRGQTAALRLIPAGSMHLTLAFLGERSEDETARLIEAARTIALQPMTQATTGWLWLPRAERPRVLALGVTADAAFMALADQLLRRLDQVGWERPQRELLPHVSLARVGHERERPGLAPPPSLELRWAGLGLYSSHLTQAGPQYQALWSVASGQSSGQT